MSLRPEQYPDSDAWNDLNDRLEAFHEELKRQYREGQHAMNRMFFLSPSVLSEPPTEELQTTVELLASTQSLPKLISFYNRLFETAPTPIHPALVSTIISSVEKMAAIGYKCAPIASHLKDFVVHIESYFTDPDAVTILTEPYLSLMKTCIDDPDQKCIGFSNSNRYISGRNLTDLKNAIEEKDIREVTDSVVNFWKRDGEFADDGTIQLAYHLLMEIGERHSQDSTFPLPLGFQDASDALGHIVRSNTVRLRDRQRIAYFYLQAHNCLSVSEIR